MGSTILSVITVALCSIITIGGFLLNSRAQYQKAQNDKKRLSGLSERDEATAAKTNVETAQLLYTSLKNEVNDQRVKITNLEKNMQAMMGIFLVKSETEVKMENGKSYVISSRATIEQIEKAV
jgi:hypothetical protein